MPFIFICLFLFFGCSGPSVHDYRDKGEEKIKNLVSELKKIRSREDLALSEDRLKKAFTALAEVMKDGGNYISQHPEEDIPPLLSKNRALSDELKAELTRVYRLEGGIELIEKCQMECLKLLN